jgi:hypothetical protein
MRLAGRPNSRAQGAGFMDQLMSFTTAPMALTIVIFGVMLVIWFACSLRGKSG